MKFSLCGAFRSSYDEFSPHLRVVDGDFLWVIDMNERKQSLKQLWVFLLWLVMLLRKVK